MTHTEKFDFPEERHSCDSNSAVTGVLLGTDVILGDPGPEVRSFTVEREKRVIEVYSDHAEADLVVAGDVVYKLEDDDSKYNYQYSTEPKPSTIATDYTEADFEIYGNFMDEFVEDDVHEPEQHIVEEEEDQDTDYKPKAIRNKRHRSSRANKVSRSTPTSKQEKFKNSVPRSKSQFQCKICDHSAKDAVALQKHFQAAHTRSYVCTFSFAGCEATFNNKNEWKRHVDSQHLGLQYWICDIGMCSNSKANTSMSSYSNSNSRTERGVNEFNRKDLFTQHLRRMHTPFPIEMARKTTPEWEERIKELQVNCLRVRRTPPQKTKCPVRACGLVFEGLSSWDNRMEHLGSHFEKAYARSIDPAFSIIVEEESDEFTIEWALRERIIEKKMSGGYKLCRDDGAVADNDSKTDEGSNVDAEDEGKGPAKLESKLVRTVELKIPNAEKYAIIQQSMISHDLPDSAGNTLAGVSAVSHHLSDSVRENGAWALYEGSVALYQHMLPTLIAKYPETEFPSSWQETFHRLAMWGEGLDNKILKRISEPRYELKDTLLDLTSNLARILTIELLPIIEPLEACTGIAKELKDQINGVAGLMGYEEEAEDSKDEGSDKSSQTGLLSKSRIPSVKADLKLYVGLLMKLLPSIDKTITRMEKESLIT